MKKSVCLTSSTSYQETVTQIKHAVMNLLHEALGSFDPCNLSFEVSTMQIREHLKCAKKKIKQPTKPHLLYTVYIEYIIDHIDYITEILCTLTQRISTTSSTHAVCSQKYALITLQIQLEVLISRLQILRDEVILEIRYVSEKKKSTYSKIESIKIT